jgi:beta-lactamase regulating signal transducer with metallopeptidase domain
VGNIVTVTGNDGEVRLRQATTPFGETIAQGLINKSVIGDIVVLVICGVDNCVAFVDMISSFIWVIGCSVGLVICFAHTHTYQYDANGNQLSSTSNANNSNRAITYTTFNKTKRLTTQTPNGFEINEISYDVLVSWLAVLYIVVPVPVLKVRLF